ncbi:MAG TPA: TetR/AcrR family transcriptional regulator [Jatrophihabitantaceae bacterium]|nr:TetR/AcrR family transcriptional regulator [Jatrophihabitantaceae bacterium]
MTAPKLDGRVERGDQTRRAILDRAAAIASVEGLEGVSIGRLATELEVSKSGVFAHFGSKEELQLATVRWAREVFIAAVITPAHRSPAGLRRLWRLCDAWLDYSTRRVFPGGCFFASVTAEFDARPGRVRDAIAAAHREWQRYLEESIATARELGELSADADPRQLAFELDAFTRATQDALLFDEQGVYTRARRAILHRLRAVATDPAVLPKSPR